MLVFRTANPIAAFKLGDEISGLTAGRGRDGAGEADRRKEGDEPKDDRRLEVMAGGSIGNGVVSGVPGFEGAGEAMARVLALARCMSGGAGLFEDIRRLGKSILLNFPCVDKVHVPSLSFNA
jgi:hypothetical protein